MKGIELKDKLFLAKIKQGELATMIGMSKQQMSNTLNSESHVSSELLEKICKAIGKPMSFFYPEETTIITNTNVNTQRAHNISNGTGDIHEGASSDQELIKKLLEQNSQLISMLKDNLGK